MACLVVWPLGSCSSIQFLFMFWELERTFGGRAATLTPAETSQQEKKRDHSPETTRGKPYTTIRLVDRSGVLTSSIMAPEDGVLLVSCPGTGVAQPKHDKRVPSLASYAVPVIGCLCEWLTVPRHEVPCWSPRPSKLQRRKQTGLCTIHDQPVSW
jgi:hypothetical protein